MTAAISQQTIPVKDSAGVRKRRRRATAGGAADDCFTCSKRNVKCDRRRPYCSQCLEIGNECSGYKTQLTWGVGVASRGKLRGLSLPVAKAPPVSKEPRKTPVRSRSSTTTIQHTSHTTTQANRPHVHAHPHVQPQWMDHDESRRQQRPPMDIPVVTQAASAPATPYGIPGYDYMSVSHPDQTQHIPHGSWGSIQYSPGGMIHHSPDATPKYKQFPLPLITDNLPSSLDSVGSDIDYMSPLSQSYTREDMPFVHSPTILYDGYTTAPSTSTSHTSPVPPSPPALIMDQSRAPTSCPSLVYAPSEASSSLGSHMDPFESHLSQKMMRECEHLRVPRLNTYNMNGNAARIALRVPQQHKEEELKSVGPEEGRAQWSTSELVSQDILAKMPFFMDYYKSTMCPSMVFIDGPENPFRENILQLAAESQSLQHAICALAACNLRMRRKLSLGLHTRELSENLRLEKQALEGVNDAQLEDKALSEEYQHRNLAVHLLNQQLNDPDKSSHDSVLATILLLCHYRMVESGIAKFHTQFAGVKKILSLRAQKFGSSPNSGWIEALFTYFDAISASINNREAQLVNEPDSGGSEVKLLPQGAENLVGCDRQLFKTISRLGRLNMLSQHCSMQSSPRADQQWSGEVLGNNEPNQALFRKEWNEARSALQQWQFDAAKVSASLPGSPNPDQVQDLGAVSEAFRYAALLYVERLAAPLSPSSHSDFQNLVSQVVYYATSLENGSSAEKFLLWPLFVAGSECINDLQQNLVRTKCADIMARSGYMNNLAALDLLENIWVGNFIDKDKRNTSGEAGTGKCGRVPFNWAQCIGGPGVEMEWIMF